tara:strand:- start:12107 stop:12343 length:237 start_codon:yes stop_codon:yes gene_type:complete
MKDKELPIIEDGVPIPPIKRKLTSQYEEVVFNMKIGSSFLVPKKRKHTATRSIERTFGKGSYAARDIDLEYCRVWRIK